MKSSVFDSVHFFSINFCAAYMHLSATISLGSSPDAQTESTLVDHICQIVNDVDHGLRVVRESGSQVDKVVSERVDDPSDRDNHTKGVEGGLSSLGSRSASNFGALTREDFVQDVQPSAHTDDESNKDRDGSNLTEISTNQHDDGGEEELVEELFGHTSYGREDEIELNDLKRHGDEPISVSVDGRRVLCAHPSCLHEQIVPCGNARDEHSYCDGFLPTFWNAITFEEEKNRTRQHSVHGDVER